MRATTIILTLTTMSVMSAESPAGWYQAGSKREAYETGLDATGAHGGKSSGYIKSIAGAEMDKFGNLMQNIKADRYRGKKVRLSAYMKTSDAEQGAWLWLRIDDNEGGWLDNMHDRLVKGTTPWQRYELVLPVSSTATGIAFGICVTGTGQAWMDDVKLEGVDSDTPRTGEIPELRLEPQQMESRKKLLESYGSKPSAGVNLDLER